MNYRLGVLGGMGPQATNTFYQFIIDRTDARTDQEHVNALILSDCQMPDRTQRDVVHILTTHPDWTQTARSPWLVDMVKHELSHRSIMISCGTTQPTIAADRTEAVTNSYSVLFFGADRNRIADQQQGVAEYAMDAHSDQLATAIHDGNCG